jgi:hypothetical protein
LDLHLLRKRSGIAPVAAIVVGLCGSTLLSTGAHAQPSLPVATTCAGLSGVASGTFSGGNKSYKLDLKRNATIKVTLDSGITGNGYTILLKDGSSTVSQISDSLPNPNGATVVKTISPSSDISDAIIELQNNGGNNFHFSISCTAPVQSNTETTSKDVISSVSRSQTTVIQQNIGARVSAVTGAVGGTTGGSVGSGAGGGVGGATGTGGTGSNGGSDNGNGNGNGTRKNDSANLFSDTTYYGSSSNGDALRRLAMSGDFDSSQGMLAAALGLGPTDQGGTGSGNSGATGGAGGGGRSAFATTTPFTVWGHGSYTSVDNNYVNGSTDNRYDGDVWGYNVGLDYRFSQALTAGMSVGYNDTDLTTGFNSGTYKEKGWVLSPYAIYRPIDNLSIVAEGGFGQGDIDETRSNGTITGSTNSDMWYMAVKTAYAVHPAKDLPLSLTPSVSVVAAQKRIDAYTESDNTAIAASRANTRQIKPSIEAAYDFAPSRDMTVTPFINTGLVYDFTDEINNDKR